MLALTDNAVSVIRDLAATTQTPETTGVRIAIAQDQEQLSLALAPASADGDQVVEDQGARVYLEQEAASMLADRTLDAAVEQDGSVQFFVATSPEA